MNGTRLIGLALAAAWTVFGTVSGIAPAAAQTKPSVQQLDSGAPGSAIFIGNSFFYFNNGMPGQVGNLVKAADPAQSLRATMVTISGAGIDWHDVDSYFRPNAIGSYSFDAGNNVVFNRLNKLFDVAVLMDCSQCPIHPKLKPVFQEFVVKNAASIRKNNAEPVLFMSWAYADKPEMTAELADAYTRAGNEVKALVIPAGLAFARSIAARPDVNLYHADKRHPSPLGTYLAACTTYAALYNKSPVGLSFTAGIDPATAAYLQAVAWDTVEAYRKP
jgi:hypothetical protein